MLTPPQALAFINAAEAETLASSKPCPDLLAWIAATRADPARVIEAEAWAVYDGDVWQAATLVEYSNGQLAVVVQGEGAAGVVILADGRFYPVTGDPSAEWCFALGDDHAGFTTLDAAL